MAKYPPLPEGWLKMGTRKPGHDHGFEDACTPSCDGYVVEKPRHNHPAIDACTMNCPVATWGMPMNHEVVRIEGGSQFDAAPGGYPVTTLGVSGMEINYGDEGNNVPAETDDASFILTDVLPHLLEKFLHKNAQYARAQTGHDLGIKGIIPDINRKSAAIITAVWDGGTIEGGDVDGVVDIAEDLVGHLLLLLAKTRSA